MKEHGAAAACDRGQRVVIDLDDVIIEMILAREPVAAGLAAESDRLIVMTAGRVFAPGIVGTYDANRQESLWSGRAVGTPPQSTRPESPFRGPAVALAFIGDDSAPAEGDRDGLLAGPE